MRRVWIALVLALAVLTGGCAPGSGEQPTRLTAVFADTTNLFEGSEVRVLGLTVGEVTDITPSGGTVDVAMAVDADRPLPADVTARLVPTSLLGERVVELSPAYTGGERLADGAVLGPDRTSQPPSVDEVLASFEHFLSSLDRRALADLIDSMAGTLEGQGADLNELIDEGSETVRVLSNSSGDLNALVSELADLNETLATRDERIGDTLEEVSTTLRTVAEERENIVGSVAQLQRLTAQLRPLLDDHGEALVTDLEQLTTSLSTVERNLARVGEAAQGSRELFTGFGRAFDYPAARWNLHNETEDLTGLVTQRVVTRLVGVCLRLDVERCDQASHFSDAVDEAARDRDEGTADLGRVVAGLINSLPREARDQLGEQPLAPPPPDDDPTSPPADGEPPADGSGGDGSDDGGLLDDLLGAGS